VNILYIAQRVPHPPNRGDKLAAYHAVRHLARKHVVTVAALADSREELAHAATLEALGIRVEVALRRPAAARRSAFRALVTGEPLSLAYYYSPELARRIRRRACERPFDVVVAFSSSMGQYAAPGVPLIADFVDMDSRKWDAYSAACRWPLSWVYGTEARRLLAYERWLAGRAYCTLVRTEAERRDCIRLIPEARFEVLANGVDLEYFRPEERRRPDPRIVFTGVMDYWPNVQAVTHFCEAILPRVRKEVPQASFTIVGSRPTRAVRALGRHPGVTVTGAVPDVRPYLRAAAVAVAPLLLARGVQNKVLEAMAMATPVVVTPAAFRGVDAPEREGLLVADTPEAFACQVATILRDPALAFELGRRGRCFVERNCVWAEKLSRLETILEQAVYKGHQAPVRARSGTRGGQVACSA
jgi:sugar transferase (PEP-CTERM/EpsH1 system associated)